MFQGAAVEGVELLAASAFFLFDRLQQSSGHREGLGVVGGALATHVRPRACLQESFATAWRAVHGASHASGRSLFCETGVFELDLSQDRLSWANWGAFGRSELQMTRMLHEKCKNLQTFVLNFEPVKRAECPELSSTVTLQ